MPDSGDWMEPAQRHWDAARGRKEFESGPEILARAMAMVAEETWASPKASNISHGLWAGTFRMSEVPPDLLAEMRAEIIAGVMERLKES